MLLVDQHDHQNLFLFFFIVFYDRRHDLPTKKVGVKSSFRDDLHTEAQQ